ncbi:MAG: hypothetical protein WAL30_04520 [Candidatus Aquirickettsiella sp.]
MHYCLNEGDFKAGNVGIDAERRVVKIDGGLCFAERKRDQYSFDTNNFNIIRKDIEALPALDTHEPANWLDFIEYIVVQVTDSRGNIKNECQSIKNPKSNLLKLSDSALDFFRKERDQILLRICLLPEKFIQYFTQAYIEDTDLARELADFIINRKNQLETTVNQIKSFQEYKSSVQAKKDIQNFIAELKSFKTTGKSVLLTELKKNQNYDVEKYICDKFLKGYSAITAPPLPSPRRNRPIGNNFFNKKKK